MRRHCHFLTWLILVLAPVFCAAANKGSFFKDMTWADSQLIVCFKTYQALNNLNAKEKSPQHRDAAINSCKGDVDDFDSAYGNYRRQYPTWHWPSQRVYDQARVFDKQWSDMTQPIGRFFICLDLYRNGLPHDKQDENQARFWDGDVFRGRDSCIAQVPGLPADFKKQLDDFYGWAELFPSKTILEQARNV
ncbi:hypothetical protein F4778DRAFT_757740, partial [Xylariomycetidae sp. FL2044]